MKKKLSGLSALLVTASMLAGCGAGQTAAETTAAESADAAATTAADGGTQTTPADSDGGAAEAGTPDSYAAWKDIDRNKVVAHLSSGENSEYFDVKFGDFYGEYIYYLRSYGITDDMADDVKENCETYRNDIITFLTFEKIYLYIAEHEYGISESTLTAEQRAEVEACVEEARTNWGGSFHSTAVAELGENASEEAVAKRCAELLDEDMAKCGLPSDIFYKWELSRYIQNLVIEKITSEAAVSDSEVDEFYESVYEEAKQAYETDPYSYEENESFTYVYLPEGTRVAKHIWVSFDEDKLEEIATQRDLGNGEEADKLVNEADTEEIKAKINEVWNRLESGEDFAALQEEYNTYGSDEYVVVEKSVNFFDEYKNTLYSLEKGQISEPIRCDNGYFIIQYVEDAVIDDGKIAEIKQSMREFLEYYAAGNAQNEAYTKWIEQYPYEIDYELLQISQENVSE